LFSDGDEENYAEDLIGEQNTLGKSVTAVAKILLFCGVFIFSVSRSINDLF